jgi:hypothetical protein
MSYTNNPLSILAGTGVTITPTTGNGANTITISAAGTQIIQVRSAAVSPITVVNTDDVISVEVTPAAPVIVNLPTGTTGQVFNIKDGLGLAAPATPITINPTGVQTIDGANTATIDAPYGSVALVFSGVEWLIL